MAAAVGDFPIEAIRITNFRGFRNAELPLKPLTILLGPNSAGKSSFGRALASLSHGHRSMIGVGRGRISPTEKARDTDDWPVDLGTFRELLTHDGKDIGSKHVEVGVQVGGEWIDWGFGDPATDELVLSMFNVPRGPAATATSATTEPVKATPAVDGATTQVVELGVTRAGREDLRLVRNALGQWDDGTHKITVETDGLELLAASHPLVTAGAITGAASSGVFFDPIPMRNAIAALNRVAYLRPNRIYPRHRYKLSETRTVGFSGESTAAVLHRYRDQVRAFLPPPAPRTIDEALGQLDQPWKEEHKPLTVAVGEWLARLGLARDVKTAEEDADVRLDARLQTSGEYRALTDLGFGVSQVLPILVAGFVLPPVGQLIVELPEAHLHPRPQAELADYFCSLVQSGHRALVETHSEMFFHRLRLRAALDASLAEKIAVYYVDPPDEGGCRSPYPVDLGLEGEPTWPEGFLMEGLSAEVAIRAARSARRARKPK